MSIVGEPGQMAPALEKAFEQDDTVLLERCIQGMEITGAVLGNRELTALPIVEIIPGPDHSFFDYEAKYQPGATKEVCPARLSKKLTQQACDLAMACHRALFCKGYSRTDMMVDKDGIWILETNTIPGMVPTSLLPQAANAAGISFSALLDRLIDLALEKVP
jgi:D-alanine-D-alanine ligase